MVVATFAIHPTHSMYRSLPTTWVVATGTSKPSSSNTKSCNSSALSPCAAPVPTAPRNFPVMHRGRNSLNLSRWRLISSIHTATFNPNVIGTAACPWVLPSITVSFSLSAISHKVSISLMVDFSCNEMLSLICKATAESTISLLVAPRWTHHPASPAASAIALVSAIMSCLVSASSSSTRSAVTIPGSAISAIAS